MPVIFILGEHTRLFIYNVIVLANVTIPGVSIVIYFLKPQDLAKTVLKSKHVPFITIILAIYIDN